MNKNSRLLYYLKYYRQLSPENFKIKKEGDKIVIELMDQENFKKGGLISKKITKGEYLIEYKGKKFFVIDVKGEVEGTLTWYIGEENEGQDWFTKRGEDALWGTKGEAIEMIEYIVDKDEKGEYDYLDDPDYYKKGGKVKTWKDKYNEKYGFEKGKSHSLKDISKTTGISMKGIQQIYDKGIGAYKTNPQSVRPNVKSKEQWAFGRVYSAVMGGKAAKVDAKELKMERGGELKYIEIIPDSHKEKLERDRGKFEYFDTSEYKQIPYPDLNSAELRAEMFYLNSLPLDEEFVEEGDKVLQNFYNYLRENDLHLTPYQLDELMDSLYQITPIVFELKYFYNRPRPYQVAPKLGLPLEYLEVASAETPAYPSGHSTQGIFIGHYLGDIFPEHRDNLIEIGNNIGISRLIGRLHYPTDDILGKYLGYGLYKYYNGE